MKSIDDKKITTGNLLEGEGLGVPHVKIQRVEEKTPDSIILFGFGKF